MEKIVAHHDIYNEHGVLLISKGSTITLSIHKCRQLYRMGILKELLQSKDEQPISHPFNDKFIPVEDNKVQINKAIQEMSARLVGANSLVLQHSTDILSNIIFESEDENWYRFVSLICTYVDWLYTHSINTALLSCVIASTLGYDDHQLYDITLGALFHDIGFTLLPQKALSKFSGFTEVEKSIIKNHCEMGYSMINEDGMPTISKKLLLQHHERLDGSGYPTRLQQNQIESESMITIVADYFDTATTAKPHRSADSVQTTLYNMYLDENAFPKPIVRTLMDNLAVELPTQSRLDSCRG